MSADGYQADGFARRLRRGDVSGLLRRHADLLLAILVVSIVAMMIVPLPTFLLDLLISLNISFAVVLLMVGIYVSDPLRVSAFPTILLITTLFRLALNVSSTRLILLQADAGEVIRAFGEFVVRGNFVVGAIVFLILTLIQFIVIAKGSERVAEVAARFTLDALPGKQMAIDADVRAGAITQDQARRRRRVLEREAQMYGSMDGAMKFVKGDAIAGIVITVVNIVGGLVVGVTQHQLSAGEALRGYGLLTIGDGLVSQIPALLISVAAGLIVTRVASEEEGAHLGRDIGGQILAQPRALAIAAGLLVTLALVPGLPKLPFLLLALFFGAVAWSLVKRARPTAAPAGEEALGTPVAAIALELAPDLAEATGLADGAAGQLVGQTLPQLRRTVFAELGVALPAVHARRLPGAPPGTWRLLLADVPVAAGTLPAARLLVVEEPDRLAPLGIVAHAALVPGSIARRGSWVRPDDAPALAAAGFTCFDAAAALAMAVHAALRRHAHELVGIQETRELLDALERTHPALVREVVPRLVPPPLLAEVLRRLVEEGVSVRDLRSILGALADAGRAEKDAALLTEHVRLALRRQISFVQVRGAAALPVWLIEPMIDDAIRDAVTRTHTGTMLALEPELSRDILASFRRAFAVRTPDAPPPVVVTTMDVRRHLKKLIEIEHPDAVVLSFQELAPGVNLQPVGRIGAS